MKLVLQVAVAALAVTAVSHAASAQTKDVVDTALADPQLSTWARAVKKGGMDSTLHLTPGHFTLFVPTNAAFAKLPPATLKKFFDNSIEGQEAVVALVMRHTVVGSTLRTADLRNGSLKPIMGPPITIKNTSGKTQSVTVNHARIVRGNMAASNGIIHVVDAVFPAGRDDAKP